MNILRHDPWSLVNQFNELNKIFDKRLSSNEDNSTVETSHWVPSVDIKEEPSRFVLYADIPGVEPKDIEISMENSVLTIKGERKSETRQNEAGYTRIERRTGTFYRRFALPDTADAEAISAHGKHGVLEVIIPKREKAKARKIEVADKN